MAEAKTNSRNSNHLPPVSLACALLLAVAVAYGLHALFIAGPATRAAAQEHLEQTIADEDRRFCENFGMRSGSSAFVACSGELATIRQRQVDRDNAAAQGIL